MAGRNLGDLALASYDEDSGATCRITINILLVQCLKHLRNKCRLAETSQTDATDATDATNPSTPTKTVVNMEPLKHVKLFPDFPLSVQMDKKNGKFLVTGRAEVLEMRALYWLPWGQSRGQNSQKEKLS
jgi:hypothetical protein